MAESGLVIIDKGAGLTSHDVVARVRRMAGTRKVGHAGTLDPMATGVLVVGVERATRLLGHLMLTSKRYAATVQLGVSTDSDDADGEVTATADASHLVESQIREAFLTQVGAIEQVPTKVSAIKVNGKRAYDLAREGIEVELKARPVTIHSLEVIEVRGTEVDIEVHCSSGTYIRAIARDVGALLGVGGHLTALRRTAVGPYTLDDAQTIEALGENYVQLPIAAAARAAFPGLELDEQQEIDVRIGRKLAIELQEITALFAQNGDFLALYEPSGENRAKAVAVFV